MDGDFYCDQKNGEPSGMVFTVDWLVNNTEAGAPLDTNVEGAADL